MRELVERARDGDHIAYGRLVATRAARLYALAYLMMRDRPAAEDAVQDACIKSWRDLKSLRDPDRYDAWLRRLLVRTCIDHLRRRRRRPAEVAMAPTHEPRSGDASGAIANRDELEQAFEKLSPHHRAVVVLAHFDELSMEEIATSLGIPVGTVKSRLHYALRALRSAIEAGARMPADRRGETT